MSPFTPVPTLSAIQHAETRPRERWLPMAYGMAALLLLYAVWQLSGVSFGDRTLVGDAFFYPVGVAAIAAAVGALRRCHAQPRLRLGWGLVALASASYLGGDVAQTAYEFVGSKPYPSVADALYIMFYPLMLWGLLLLPIGRRSLAERVRLGLDIAIVAIGGFVVVIYVVLGPTIVQSGPDTLQTAFSIAYPVGDLILLVGLASVLLRHPAASSVRALQFMAVSLLFFVAADLLYGYITLHSTYHGGDPVRLIVDDRNRVLGGGRGGPDRA